MLAFAPRVFMCFYQARQVHIGEGVAADDEEGIIKKGSGVSNAARRAERVSSTA